jgi:hypothetical protein
MSCKEFDILLVGESNLAEAEEYMDTKDFEDQSKRD